MKIYCKTNTEEIPTSKLVNIIGKYLYKHIEGAYKYKQGGNQCDIYVTLLYQLKPEYGGKVNDVNEMTIDINLTTYQKKIRVNTIEVSPMERTLGCDVIKREDLSPLEDAQDLIQFKVGNRIRKAYSKYDILF